jgi:hypothetical protein
VSGVVGAYRTPGGGSHCRHSTGHTSMQKSKKLRGPSSLLASNPDSSPSMNRIRRELRRKHVNVLIEFTGSQATLLSLHTIWTLYLPLRQNHRYRSLWITRRPVLKRHQRRFTASRCGARHRRHKKFILVVVLLSARLHTYPTPSGKISQALHRITPRSYSRFLS